MTFIFKHYNNNNNNKVVDNFNKQDILNNCCIHLTTFRKSYLKQLWQNVKYDDDMIWECR